MGIPVIESPWAYTREPARVCKSGNKRIQKKWNKRYGFVNKPAVFFINNGQTILVSPGHFGMIKSAIEDTERRFLYGDGSVKPRNGGLLVGGVK